MKKEFNCNLLIYTLITATGGGNLQNVNCNFLVSDQNFSETCSILDAEPAPASFGDDESISNNYILKNDFLSEELYDFSDELFFYTHYCSARSASEEVFNLNVSQYSAPKAEALC